MLRRDIFLRVVQTLQEHAGVSLDDEDEVEAVADSITDLFTDLMEEEL